MSGPSNSAASVPSLRGVADAAIMRRFLDAGGDPNATMSTEEALREFRSPRIPFCVALAMVAGGLGLALATGLVAVNNDSSGLGGQDPGAVVHTLFSLAGVIVLVGFCVLYWCEVRRRWRGEIYSTGEPITLAMACCLWGHAAAESLRLLIEKNANITLETSAGETAYSLAKRAGGLPPDLEAILFSAENRNQEVHMAPAIRINDMQIATEGV